MLIHTVFFWLKPDVKGVVNSEFEAAFSALTKIDSIHAASVGKPAATEPRPVTDHSWDYALHLSFATREDHDAYQVHPDHDVFIDQCKEWWEKVKVYDTQV